MIEVRRRFAATPERVFDAWTVPAELCAWWSAGPSHRPGRADVDARVGGEYRLSMIDDDGVENVVGGEYVEVRRPKRLVFTWRWQEGRQDPTGGTTSLTVSNLTPGTTYQFEVRVLSKTGWSDWTGSVTRMVI